MNKKPVILIAVLVLFLSHSQRIQAVSISVTQTTGEFTSGPYSGNKYDAEFIYSSDKTPEVGEWVSGDSTTSYVRFLDSVEEVDFFIYNPTDFTLIHEYIFDKNSVQTNITQLTNDNNTIGSQGAIAVTDTETLETGEGIILVANTTDEYVLSSTTNLPKFNFENFDNANLSFYQDNVLNTGGLTTLETFDINSPDPDFGEFTESLIDLGLTIGTTFYGVGTSAASLPTKAHQALIEALSGQEFSDLNGGISYCPVDLMITDEFGNVYSKDSNLDDFLYFEGDFLGNGDTQDLFLFANKDLDYEISVIPDSTALVDDIFSLTIFDYFNGDINFDTIAYQQLIGAGSNFAVNLDGLREQIYGPPVSPNPVPEPTTILLFGTGVVGLIGTRLRRKKK